PSSAPLSTTASVWKVNGTAVPGIGSATFAEIAVRTVKVTTPAIRLARRVARMSRRLAAVVSVRVVCMLYSVERLSLSIVNPSRVCRESVARDGERDRVPAAEAEGGEPRRELAVFECVKERGEDPGAGRAD